MFAQQQSVVETRKKSMYIIFSVFALIYQWLALGDRSKPHSSTKLKFLDSVAGISLSASGGIEAYIAFESLWISAIFAFSPTIIAATARWIMEKRRSKLSNPSLEA